jgi:hypothetical protein
VRTQQVHLQLAALLRRDADVAQFADASCNGVRNLVVVEDVVDDGASAFDGDACIGRKQHSPLLVNNFVEVFEG